ncbi:phenylacetate--CoA ligase family protein [Desulfomonile tiedjei]|uniref:Coenzyme F390 synthetase n=1 Tax=Desulfomonile tiedjei (strain ATCC 49306 / DSM 6799 / DCB-1) TaxID=706587 RepID=I4C1Q8_DESTA|nr:phenylacetate--CoA ligase family protein [Desulfomonile tiedjei]AFM23499.1 coenzyme F390 synthetase [Desulfomonile tiedjei DSM 6799]
MLEWLKSYVRKAPTPFVAGAEFIYRLIPPKLRYGKGFRDALHLLEQSEHWNHRELTAYQEKKLEPLIHHCFANVPYYRRLFDERGLKPQDFQSSEDLKKLPYLTKRIITRERNNLIARNMGSWRRDPAHTSGSTGSPFDFYVDDATLSMDRALALRHMFWLGYRKSDSVARFRVFRFSNPNKLLEYDRVGRELRLTLDRGDERELAQTADALNSFKPDFISAWPSCLYVLARWLKTNRRKIHSPRYIITSSENLYPHMRETIEVAIGAPVIDWYGQEESVAVAMQCAEARGYHIQMEAGYVELVPRHGGYFEIVGTNLHNFVMPFLRYRTGDLVTGSFGTCTCGRQHPTLSGIIGRESDLIVTPGNTVVSSLGLNFVFHHLDEVKESQIVQESLNSLHIKVVPWNKLGTHTLKTLEKRVREHMQWDAMDIRVEQVDHIPRNAGGKRPFFLSHVQLHDSAVMQVIPTASGQQN